MRRRLAQVLAAGGLDQPVEGVVGVVVARLDALVPEVDGLLRVVADVGDVAGRVVGVVQVLQAAGMPCGAVSGAAMAVAVARVVAVVGEGTLPSRRV